MIKMILCGILYFAPNIYADSNGIRSLTLFSAEELALVHSTDQKIAESSIRSIESKLEAVSSRKYPQLFLEGSYKYLEVVPQLNTPASPKGSVSLGDNSNYSIGPAITYNLFDGGFLRNTLKSLEKLKESKTWEKEYVKSMILLSVRLAYLNVLLTKEQHQLAFESYKLSQTQNEDIKKKRKWGALSDLDLSLSNRDLLNQELNLNDFQIAEDKAIMDLYSLLGRDHYSDEHSVNYDFDSLESILNYLQSKSSFSSSSLAPKNEEFRLSAQLLSIQKKIESGKYEIQSENSQYWPQISLKFKTSLDYPNGPNLETIHQNSFGLNLVFPLYDWGERQGAKKEKLVQVEIWESQMEKIGKDNQRDLKKWEMELQQLKKQEIWVGNLVAEAEKVAKINLSSFQSGKIQFTEVERSQVKKVEAQVRRILLKGRMFAVLSQIEAISPGGLR